MKTGDTFRFRNFPIKSETEKLEFVITWEDETFTLKDGKKHLGETVKKATLLNGAIIRGWIKSHFFM